MKTITLKEIEELRNFIAEKKARAISISARLGEIAASIATMSLEELETVDTEKDELVKELNDILDDKNCLNRVMIRELEEIAKEVPSGRRTMIEDEVEEIVIDKAQMIVVVA